MIKNPLAFVCIISLEFSIEFMVDRPRDTVAMLRKQVIFHCSSSDVLDAVEWFFQSGNAKIRLWKTPGFKHKKYFDTFDILESYGVESDIRHDLLLKRVELEHTGSFVCTVISKSNKTSRSGRLSVLDVEDCKTYFVDDILGHKCRILSSGHHNYTIYWNCAHEAVENISSSFYAIKNILSDHVKVQVSILMVMMNLKHQLRLTACRMDIQSVDVNDVSIVEDDDKESHFSISVYQLSPILKLIPDNYTEACSIGERGQIHLDTEIVFQEKYQQHHQLEIGHVKELLSYTCEIIRFSSTIHIQTLDLMYLNATCEYLGALKCMMNFTFLLRSETDIFYLSRRQHKFLCSHLEEAEECLWHFQPCTMSKKMTGYLESYKAICSPEYDALKKPASIPNTQRCFDQYPQRVELIYKRVKFNETTQDERRPNIYASQFCIHMTMLTGYLCAEHSLATDGYADFGIWYLKFVRMYRQISLRAFTPSVDSSCESTHSDVTSFKHCVVAKTCSEMFSLLLSSLHFGMIVIRDFEDFTQHLCTSDIIFMKNCVDELFYYCDPTTYVTYKSLAYMADDICVRFVHSYPKHHGCFLQLYANVDISKNCILSDLLQSAPSFKDDPIGLATQLCAVGIKYLKCMEHFIGGICGEDAAAMQKWLMKTVFSAAFDNLYCREIFQQKDWQNMARLQAKNFAVGSVGRSLTLDAASFVIICKICF